MATKLFLRNTTTNGITDSGDGVLYDMVTAAGAAVDTDQVTLTADGTEIQWTQSAGGSTIAWITGRAPSGGFTLTTTDISVWLLESNMNDEAEGRYRLFKYDGILHTVTELLGGPFDDGAELGTTITEMTWTGNPTDTIFLENDRLILRLYATNFTTMTAGTADLQFNAANAGTGDSFLNLAETISFKAEAVVNSGALSGAGAAVATAQGAAVATANLSATAASTATAAGAARAEATLSATGASTATAEGAAIVFASFDLSEAGLSTATAEGAATAGADLSAAGTSAATAAGAATASADLSALGASTAVAEGADAGGGVTYATTDLSTAGTSVATAEGAATAAADLNAAGAATATLEGLAVGAPAEEEEGEQPVTEGPGGGMWTRNPWADQKRKKRKEAELEELDLLVIGQAAVQQLAADHMRRVVGG